MAAPSVSERPPHTISPEVWTLAAQHNVTELVPQLVEMTEHVFPSLRQLDVFVEEDWEIADFRYMVFRVSISEMKPEETAAASAEWTRELVRLDSYPVSCPIVLSTEFVS